MAMKTKPVFLNKDLFRAILDNSPDDAEVVLEVDNYWEPIGRMSYDSQYNKIILMMEDPEGPDVDKIEPGPSDEDETTSDDPPSCCVDQIPFQVDGPAGKISTI